MDLQELHMFMHILSMDIGNDVKIIKRCCYAENLNVQVMTQHAKIVDLHSEQILTSLHWHVISTWNLPQSQGQIWWGWGTLGAEAPPSKILL